MWVNDHILLVTVLWIQVRKAAQLTLIEIPSSKAWTAGLVSLMCLMSLPTLPGRLSCSTGSQLQSTTGFFMFGFDWCVCSPCVVILCVPFCRSCFSFMFLLNILAPGHGQPWTGRWSFRKRSIEIDSEPNGMSSNSFFFSKSQMDPVSGMKTGYCLFIKNTFFSDWLINSPGTRIKGGHCYVSANQGYATSVSYVSHHHNMSYHIQITYIWANFLIWWWRSN